MKIWETIRKYFEISDIVQIEKGFSMDNKYIILTKEGKRYLVRITETNSCRDLAARRSEFDMIRQLRTYSDLVPRGYLFQASEEEGFCFMILDYIEGRDGEEILGFLSPEKQYGIGFEAGSELKRLHAYCAPPDLYPWADRKIRKYERYMQKYAENPLEPSGIDIAEIQAFITKNADIMEKTGQTFLHDDFHPANLIISGDHLRGIIDFNRWDYGDPIHDFYKVALFSRNISVPFSRGQVDGYHNGGEIPLDFWRKYTLYSAMTFIPDLVWSEQYDRRTGTHQERERSIKRLSILYTDHDAFRSIIPKWYS
jgi:aminoglycoside phosphotransferase (APT) family kinase protein